MSILAGALQGFGAGIVKAAEMAKEDALREAKERREEQERQRREEANRSAMDTMYGDRSGRASSSGGRGLGADPQTEAAFDRHQQGMRGGHKFRGLGNVNEFKGEGLSFDMGQDVDSNTEAMELIRRSEGFRETPYWDVNAHRIGYGSDTVTLEDGSVQRVSTQSRVSKDDAERDLMRRIQTEFTPSARTAVGPEVFDGLNPDQQAVLTSLAYNYGSGAWQDDLAGVANAVRSGGDVASAIRSLGSHNKGINRNRRDHEADIFAGQASVLGTPATYEMSDGAPVRRRGLGGGEQTVSTSGRIANSTLIDIASNEDVSPTLRTAAVRRLEQNRSGGSRTLTGEEWIPFDDGREALAGYDENGNVVLRERDGKPVLREKGGRGSKLTGEEWIPYGDGKEALAGYDENGDVVLRKRNGKPVVRKVKRDELKLSSSLDTRLRRRFSNRRGEPEYEVIDSVKEEVMRLMRDEDLSETEAEQKVLRAMVFEEEVTTGERLFFDGPKKTTVRRNKEGKGEFTGEFVYGRLDTEENEQSDIPRPKSKSEFDALASGTRFIDPEGKVRVKP